MADERIEFARKLRKQSTDEENKLWFLLQDRRLLGFKFRRQVRIVDYYVDFCCYKARLIVELDGGNHKKPESKDYDRMRDSFLIGQGFQVLRIWNGELKNKNKVINKIKKALFTPHLSASQTSSPARGEEKRK